MEHLKCMKDKLIDCIEKQISGSLEYTNAQELGEAVDMVKDLSEAIYYCTITEAMEEKSRYDQDDHYPTAHYYEERKWGGDRYIDPYRDMKPKYYDNRYAIDKWSPHEDRYDKYPLLEDRSTMSKRRYMEGKVYNDKQGQMKELELYTQELAADLTDMIKDASPEEKQLLQQKISLLATKIK